MRAIRLHDTRTGAVVPLEPREPGRVGIYACGPTVYGRIHVGNARPYVVFSLLKRFLEHEGYELTLVINVTDVNDKIYDAAARRGARSARAGARDDRALPGGHRPARPRPARPRAAGLGDHRAIVDLIGALIDGGHAYAADGDVYFRVRSYPEYGELSHRDVERHGPGRGRRGGRAQGGPARLRAVEGAEAGRGHRLGRALGPRPPGLAHRVLGHGRGAARRRLRHPRRRLGPRLPPPRERGGADPRGARRAARAALDAQRDGPAATGEKMAKSVGNICLLARGARRARAATPLVMYFSAATTASRSPSRTSALEQAAARRRRASARRAGGCADGASPADMAPLRDRFFDALADDFNTAEALAALFEWVREANRREARSARRRPARDARRPRPRQPARGRGRGRPTPEVAGAGRARRQARADARLRRRPTACATSSRARGWEVRDVAGRARARPPRRDRLRPQRRARGAARAAARCTRCGRRRGAARLSLAGRASTSTVADEAARARARLRRASGRRAPRSRPTPTPTPARCSPRPTPLIVALDQVAGPAEPRRDLPHGRGARARPAWCIPERRVGRGHARRSARPRPARSSTCASRGCATSPTSWPTRRRPAAGATAPRRRARRRYDRPTTAAASCSCSGAEGSGLRPRVAARLRRARRAAAARADRVAQRQRRGRRAAVRRSCSARAQLDSDFITVGHVAASSTLKLRVMTLRLVEERRRGR